MFQHAARETTATIAKTSEDSGGPQEEQAVIIGSKLVDALGVVAMQTAKDEQHQRRAWTDLAEALYKEGGTLQTPADAGKGLGEALARATMDGTEAAQAALGVCQAALIFAASVIRSRGPMMLPEDGTTLYLVDWEPTWEPPKHLNPELIVRFEGRRFVCKFVDLEAKEVPARKPKPSSNGKQARIEVEQKQARQKPSTPALTEAYAHRETASAAARSSPTPAASALNLMQQPVSTEATTCRRRPVTWSINERALQLSSKLLAQL
ncbi:hypothetical protein ON010_g13101 [Phytophthora cinnamomi]|nr:hypothetical protein ON010_g13101 [Phytophthora cinnamomi]